MGLVQNAILLVSFHKTITLTCLHVDQKLQWMTQISNQLASNMESYHSRAIKMAPSQSSQNVAMSPFRNVSASIVGTQKAEVSSGKSFMVYAILVTTAERDHTYTVYHRYREFDALAKSVRLPRGSASD
jgi:hypothetical protein